MCEWIGMPAGFCAWPLLFGCPAISGCHATRERERERESESERGGFPRRRKVGGSRAIDSISSDINGSSSILQATVARPLSGSSATLRALRAYARSIRAYSSIGATLA